MKFSLAVAATALAASASAAAITPRGPTGPPGHHDQPGHGGPPSHGGNPHYPPGNPSKCKKGTLVQSKKLQKDISPKALRKGAQKLQDIAYSTAGRNRLMGSEGHNKTVKYLVDTLNSLGGYYKVETQKFSQPVMVSGDGNITVNGQLLESSIMEYTPTGKVEAKVIKVNNLGCEAGDYPAAVAGNIALISRGTCEFGLKSALAGAAGAKGALLYNNVPGSLSATLGLPGRPEGAYVPTLGLSLETGTDLVAQLAAGTVLNGILDVVSDIQLYTTNNVLATTVCGDHDNTLVLGAHSDSVSAGPGINDDGSGSIGILEVAKQLAKYKVNNAVRFGWWSGEEEGLLGSTYYVDSLSAEELQKVRLYLNFDMIASPNYIHALYDGDGSAFNLTGPSGSAEIEHRLEKFFASKGENSTATAFDGRSDYQAFINNGIPAGGTFTGAEEIKTEEQAQMFGGQAGVALDANYHGAGDTIDNLAMDAFLLHTQAIADSVAEYATTYKSLPPKDAVEKRSLAALEGAKNLKRGGKWGKKARV